MSHGPKHPLSPGPWLYVVNGPRGEVIDADGHQLCELTIRNNADTNGFVMAAGFEGLAFAREFVDMIASAVAIHGEEVLSDEERELYAKARMLIFKAEGKAGVRPAPSKGEEVSV